MDVTSLRSDFYPELQFHYAMKGCKLCERHILVQPKWLYLALELAQSSNFQSWVEDPAETCNSCPHRFS